MKRQSLSFVTPTLVFFSEAAHTDSPTFQASTKTLLSKRGKHRNVKNEEKRGKTVTVFQAFTFAPWCVKSGCPACPHAFGVGLVVVRPRPRLLAKLCKERKENDKQNMILLVGCLVGQFAN